MTGRWILLLQGMVGYCEDEGQAGRQVGRLGVSDCRRICFITAGFSHLYCTACPRHLIEENRFKEYIL